MYPISETAKAMYDRNYRQVILIRMDTEEDTYTLTENDIIARSFSIDRYSITGNRIEIGTACAGECKFKIKNYDKRWDGVRFEGAQLFIRIGIADWSVPGAESNVIWMPCGYFTVDKPVKNASILSIEALDRMAKLDKPVDWSMFTGSFNPRTLISRICDLCDVIVYDGASLTRLPNANYVVSLPTDTDITYRNLLQSACMLLGACAFFNENGLLAIKWYNTTNVTIDETKRYSHTIQENNITITGIVYVDTLGEEDVEYLSGTKDYAIDISDNPLVGDNIQSVVDALGNALNGFTYRPYSASIKPSPYLYPTDIITFVKNNVSYVGIVSNVTYGINSTTSIEGRGETEEDNGYATYGNFTNVQSKIIEYANKKIDREVTDRTMLLMNLNEMIMNSLGLYETTLQPVPGGGWQYYFHDAPSIGDSTIIYTFGANGFAWTDDWNDGNPVWKYGITRDGNAIVNMLSAYKISADIITAGTMRAVNLIFGQDPNTTELRTNDAKTGALFEGTGVMQFETKGEFYAKNIDSSNNDANQIRMRSNIALSSGDANQIGFWNKRNNISSNAFYANAFDNATEFWFYNNRPGAAINANNHYMGVTSTSYINRLVNYRNGSVSSSGGAIDANSLILESYKTSTNEYNNAALRNATSSGTNVNNLTMRSTWKGSSISNNIWLDNYNNSGKLSNQIYFNSSSSQNNLNLTNYHHNVLSASNNSLTANQMNFISNSTENKLNFLNTFLKAEDGTDTQVYDANYIVASHNRSTSENRIEIVNKLISSATKSSSRYALNGNFIIMDAVPDGTNQTTISNNNRYGATANTIITDATDYPFMRLVNYQKDNTSSGNKYVASSIYLKQTSTINSFDFYNNKKSATTGLEVASGNHLAMYTYSSNSSTVFRVDNYHWNGNLGNQLDMGSFNNSSSFALRNYNSSGVARSWLTMSGDGTLELGGNTGGTSRLTLNSNGNLDLVGRNVAYVAASREDGYVAIKTKNVERICEWVIIDGKYYLSGGSVT